MRRSNQHRTDGYVQRDLLAEQRVSRDIRHGQADDAKLGSWLGVVFTVVIVAGVLAAAGGYLPWF